MEIKTIQTNNVYKRKMVETPNWEVGGHLANYAQGRGPEPETAEITTSQFKIHFREADHDFKIILNINAVLNYKCIVPGYNKGFS